MRPKLPLDACPGIYFSQPVTRDERLHFERARRRGAEVRCVFPTARYEPAESGVVSVVHVPSCALGTMHQPLLRRCLQFLTDSTVAMLLPGDCRVCGDALLRAADCPVCDGCLTALSGSRLAAGCRLCSEPLGFEPMDAGEDGIAGLCRRCVAEPPKFVRATAWGDYDELRQVVHMLKFEGVPGLARPLGRLLASAILAQREGAPDAMAAVPVPLYRGKRQYNQSMLLARSALRLVRRAEPAWSLRLKPAMLKRVAHTESQYLLSPAQRRENVRNAFAASESVQGLHVLLIDDVYTTGATAAECTRSLLRAGAASVRVATLARAVRDGATHWQPPLAPIARDGPRISAYQDALFSPPEFR